MLTFARTHIIRYPTGRYGYVGSVPRSLGDVVYATPDDVMAGRAFRDSDGKVVTVRWPTFDTHAAAVDHARLRGVAVAIEKEPRRMNATEWNMVSGLIYVTDSGPECRRPDDVSGYVFARGLCGNTSYIYKQLPDGWVVARCSGCHHTTGFWAPGVDSVLGMRERHAAIAEGSADA